MRTLTILSCALLLACGEPAAPPSQGPTSSAAPQAVLPESLFLTAPPEGEIEGVGDVKARCDEGEEVVVRAVIGGRVHPFIKNRAAMRVADASLELCEEGGCGDML